MNYITLSFLTITTALLTSCAAVGPNYTRPQQPEHDIAFRGASQQQSLAPLTDDRWWQQLGDRELNLLVSQALGGNFDVRLAGERLREARALRAEARSAFFPKVTAASSYSRVGLSETTSDGGAGAIRSGLGPDEFDQWSGGADVSWELDVFGGSRRGVESSTARLAVSREAISAARLATAAEVVETYYTLVGLQQQLERVLDNIAQQEKTLALVTELAEEGFGNEFDVSRARAQLGTTRAAAPTLRSGLISQSRRLALLLGSAPTALDGRLKSFASFPATLPLARTGLPAELVTRRPDLRIAERKLAAATAEIGVATANFYPRFFLLGGAQQASGKASDLFDFKSLAWQFAPRVEWSIFSGGRNRALLEASNSRQRQAMLEYDKAVLGAIGEVESELAGLQGESRRLSHLEQAVRETRRSVNFARERYREGDGDFLEVLVEQQGLNLAEVDEVRSKTALILTWVRLHKALGGGSRL